MNARSPIATVTVRQEGGLHPNSIGRLCYVVAILDTGLEEAMTSARAQSAALCCTVFAHRYTTAKTATGIDVTLSDEEFELRRRKGLLVMDWESRGVCYGIGTEVNYWQAKGLSVVVGGSCHHLARALSCYPDMAVIWIGARSLGQDGPPHAAQCANPRHGSAWPGPLVDPHARGSVTRVPGGVDAGEGLLAALIDEEIQRKRGDRR